MAAANERNRLASRQDVMGIPISGKDIRERNRMKLGRRESSTRKRFKERETDYDLRKQTQKDPLYPSPYTQDAKEISSVTKLVGGTGIVAPAQIARQCWLTCEVYLQSLVVIFGVTNKETETK